MTEGDKKELERLKAALSFQKAANLELSQQNDRIRRHLNKARLRWLWLAEYVELKYNEEINDPDDYGPNGSKRLAVLARKKRFADKGDAELSEVLKEVES